MNQGRVKVRVGFAEIRQFAIYFRFRLTGLFYRSYLVSGYISQK